MAGSTDRLGLSKPDDGSGDWGDDYRAAMDAIDAHPGIRVVWGRGEITDPWVGQTIFEASTATLVSWSGIEWKEAVGQPPAPANLSYRHVQGSPSSVWHIAHNLGYFPGGILVKDSAGDIHEGRVSYIDINTLDISFFAGGVPVAFSGEAYLS